VQVHADDTVMLRQLGDLVVPHPEIEPKPVQEKHDIPLTNVIVVKATASKLSEATHLSFKRRMLKTRSVSAAHESTNGMMGDLTPAQSATEMWAMNAPTK
jgi:hypothetical protein